MTVLDYIDQTDPPEVRQLLLAAHLFLQDALPPFATAAIKWNIPFYKLHRNFCYLNRHRDHITLGFPHGWKLSPKSNILLGENENLKQVRYLEIRSIEDLYSDNIQQILQEAIILDEAMGQNRLRKRAARRRVAKLTACKR